MMIRATKELAAPTSTFELEIIYREGDIACIRSALGQHLVPFVEDVKSKGLEYALYYYNSEGSKFVAEVVHD